VIVKVVGGSRIANHDLGFREAGRNRLSDINETI
jgi:hypothetical protein